MKRIILTSCCVVFAIVASTRESQAQDGEARLEARHALENFFRAWNSADNARLRETINYPHVSLFGARMTIAQKPEEFRVDFDDMKTREDWAKSTLDGITFGEVSGEKVNCIVVYSRVNSEGHAYRSGRVAYIVTKVDGHWGMQFRAPLGPDDATAARAARPILDEFFEAFNAGDNARLQPLSHYPHAFLFDHGRVAVASTADDLVMNFDAMGEGEGWHHSTLDSVKLIYAGPSQVHYDIVFSRHHEDGTSYRTVPARWILTNDHGHWALQFRSLMPGLSE